MHETFWNLLRDSAHWEFEIFLNLLFDGIVAGLAWPFVRKHWAHHIARDRAEVSSTPYGTPDPLSMLRLLKIETPAPRDYLYWWGWDSEGKKPVITTRRVMHETEHD